MSDNKNPVYPQIISGLTIPDDTDTSVMFNQYNLSLNIGYSNALHSALSRFIVEKYGEEEGWRWINPVSGIGDTVHFARIYTSGVKNPEHYETSIDEFMNWLNDDLHPDRSQECFDILVGIVSYNRNILVQLKEKEKLEAEYTKSVTSLPDSSNS